MMREIIEVESLAQEEIKKLSALTTQYVIPHHQAQKRLDESKLQMLNGAAYVNTQRQTQTSRLCLKQDVLSSKLSGNTSNSYRR